MKLKNGFELIMNEKKVELLNEHFGEYVYSYFLYYENGKVVDVYAGVHIAGDLPDDIMEAINEININ